MKTQAWERLGEYITNEGADRYLEYLRQLPDKEYIFEFRAVMEFFKPKLQRAEVANDFFQSRQLAKGIRIEFTDEPIE